MTTKFSYLGCQLLAAMEESPALAASNPGPLSMPGDFNDLFLPGRIDYLF